VSALIHSTPAAAGRLARTAAALAVVAAVLTACGGGSSSSASATTTSAPGTSAGTSAGHTASTGSAEVRALTATEADFTITLDKESLQPGPYEIRVVNNGHATHNLKVQQNGSDIAGTSTIRPGQTATLAVRLEPGTYVFYCSIGNHRDMGMEKTVTVS
jgi:uncharacterized cupredoxin-like copper-binding protein